jgi:hypothetical protein
MMRVGARGFLSSARTSAGNGSWSTEAWIQYDFYQSCGWIFNCSDAFQVRVNRNGGVRYVAWGI